MIIYVLWIILYSAVWFALISIVFGMFTCVYQLQQVYLIVLGSCLLCACWFIPHPTTSSHVIISCGIMILTALVYKTLDRLKKLSWMLRVQCWKAAVFLFAWVTNTTTEFKVKIFLTFLLTFATGFHKGVYEKYAEGADGWQMFKAGLDAMVIISSIFLFLVCKLIIIILAVSGQH
jgi:hypothetical protein